MEQKESLLAEIFAKSIFSLIPKVIFLSFLPPMLFPMHIFKSDFLRASLHLRVLPQALHSSQWKPLVQGFLETPLLAVMQLSKPPLMIHTH